MLKLSDPDFVYSLYENIKEEYVACGLEPVLGECEWCERGGLLLMAFDGEYNKGNYCYECWLLVEECGERTKKINS